MTYRRIYPIFCFLSQYSALIGPGTRRQGGSTIRPRIAQCSLIIWTVVPAARSSPSLESLVEFYASLDYHYKVLALSTISLASSVIPKPVVLLYITK